MPTITTSTEQVTNQISIRKTVVQFTPEERQSCPADSYAYPTDPITISSVCDSVEISFMLDNAPMCIHFDYKNRNTYINGSAHIGRAGNFYCSRTFFDNQAFADAFDPFVPEEAKRSSLACGYPALISYILANNFRDYPFNFLNKLKTQYFAKNATDPRYGNHSASGDWRYVLNTPYLPEKFSKLKANLRDCFEIYDSHIEELLLEKPHLAYLLLQYRAKLPFIKMSTIYYFLEELERFYEENRTQQDERKIKRLLSGFDSYYKIPFELENILKAQDEHSVAQYLIEGCLYDLHPTRAQLGYSCWDAVLSLKALVKLASLSTPQAFEQLRSVYWEEEYPTHSLDEKIAYPDWATELDDEIEGFKFIRPKTPRDLTESGIVITERTCSEAGLIEGKVDPNTQQPQLEFISRMPLLIEHNDKLIGHLEVTEKKLIVSRLDSCERSSLASRDGFVKWRKGIITNVTQLELEFYSALNTWMTKHEFTLSEKLR